MLFAVSLAPFKGVDIFFKLQFVFYFCSLYFIFLRQSKTDSIKIVTFELLAGLISN